MNEKGRQTKLLAAILVLTMALAGAVIIFSDSTVEAVEGETQTPESPEATQMDEQQFLGLANDNNVITLNENVTLTETVNLTESITIDLNGFTLSMISGTMFSNVGASETPGIPDVSFTIIGEKEGSTIDAYRIAYLRADNCSLTISGGTYNADEYGFIWYDVNTNTTPSNSVEVENITISSKFSAFWLSNAAIAEASFTNCDITSSQGLGIYFATVQKAVVTDCTIAVSGNESAIEVKAGNITLDGCTLSATKYVLDDTVNSNGSGNSISTVTVNNNYDDAGKTSQINVNIIDSTITNSSGETGAKPIVLTSVKNTPINFSWSGHSVDDVVISGTIQDAITVGTSVDTSDSGTVSSTDVKEILNSNGVAVIPNGTIDSNSIPEMNVGDKIIIGSQAVIAQDAEIPVPVGAVIEFQDGMANTNFSVIGGATGNTTTVQFSNVAGNFTVTGGSVIINGTITSGGIELTGDVGNDVKIADGTEINGDVSISGTGKVTFEGALTITENGKLTLGDGIEYTIKGVLDNNGTIVLNGDIDSTAFTQTAEGLGAISGNGSITFNGAVSGLTYSVRYWSTNWTYYFDEPESIILSENYAVDAGSLINSPVTIIATTDNGDSEFVISKQGDKIVNNSTNTSTYGDDLYASGQGVEVQSGIYNGSSVTVVSLADKLQIGGVVAFGDIDIPYDEDTANSPYVTVPSGASLVIMSGTETVFLAGDIGDKEEVISQASISNGGKVFVYGTLALGTDAVANKCISNTGTVYALDKDTVSLFVNGGTVESLDAVKIEITRGYEELIENLGTGLPIEINSDITVPANDRLEIVNENIKFIGDYGIIVNGALTITDSILDKGENATEKAMITVNEKAKLDINDSKIFMVVSVNEKASVTVDNADVTYDNTTSNVKVGYGTILYLSGTPTDDIEVYGTLDVSGNVNITSGITMNVYNGATLQVSGTLNVAGKIDVAAGGAVNVTGTVTVSNELGGAAIDTEGKFIIASEGTVTIDAADSRYGQDNYLTIASGEFTVEGTLVMKGTLSGTVQDKGTVTINGKVNNATVKVYDGVTLTVTSVELAPTKTEGLIITDAGAATSVRGDKRTNTCYENNIVDTDGAKNMTITVTVKTVGTGDKRVYVSNMTVTGNIAGATNVGSGFAYDKDLGYGMEVIGDVSVQKGTLTFGNDVLLSGNVNATAKNTGVDVIGELTVTGSIVIGGENNTSDGIEMTGTLNATGYTVTTETSENDYVTYYYGTFDAVVLKAAEADDQEIVVYGAQELGANATVTDGQTIIVSKTAVLTVGTEYELTMADGSKMENNGEVVAEGKLAFANFTSTYGRSDAGITAQVVVIDDPARTYMSLNVAIENGMTDITLYQDVTITEDLTIPEGVTVTGEDKTFTVYAEENDVTLTVAGSLIMVDGSNIALANETDASGNAYEAEIVVTGIMTYSREYANEAGQNVDADTMYSVEGAHFESEYDVEPVYVISNVAYAAENCHAGNIIITGSISVGDVTFTADEDDGDLTVKVQNIYDENNKLVKNSTLVAGTLTFVRDGTATASLDLIGGTSGTVTGTIASAAGSIDLSRTNGITFTATSTEVDGETVDLTTINGAVNGDLTISAGSVSIATGLGIDFETAQDPADVEYLGAITVASGATLVVPKNATINGYVIDDENIVTIDGTILFDEGTLNGPITVNGTMQVSEDMSLDDDDVVELNGTLEVAADKTLTIEASVEMGAGSTMTGDVSITDGYIVAMPGADLTGAALNWNTASNESDAVSTEYYVNGELYATVYAQERTQIIIVLDTEDIDMAGYDEVVGWYATQDDADKALADSTSVTDVGTKNIGSIAQVYGAAKVSKVFGTISEGTGLTIYIDSLTISNWFDTNDGYYLTVGTHIVTIAADANYGIDNAIITFNGQTVQNGGTITVGADDTTFTLSASGATPSGQTVVIDGGSGGSDGMGLTDYLLIILVILIVIMAIMVAFRLMRS